MLISRQEAVSLVSKWHAEQTLLHYVLVTPPAIEVAVGIGQVREVNDFAAQIRGDFLANLEGIFSICIPLQAPEAEYDYRDHRELKAPAEVFDEPELNRPCEARLVITLPRNALIFGIFACNEELQREFLGHLQSFRPGMGDL